MKTDSKLQHDVMAELEWDPRVDHAEIGVAVVDGVVTLNGFVRSYAEKIAAERAAQRISGVTAIAEELKVRLDSDPKTADHEIAKRIVDILRWNVLVPSERIQVKVEDGWVTLTGEVTWNYQREEARKSASKIGGVKSVVNQIRVCQMPTAGDIGNRIEAAFERQADLDAAGVSIAVEGHKVRLNGKVRSWHERQVAERAAWAAPGVTQVDDRLEVI